MSKHIVTVKMPFITDRTITCEFIIDSTIYSNSYQFPEDIPKGMADSRILRWLGITTSMGMFSIEYFDEVHCDFLLTNDEIIFFEKLFYQGLGEFRYINNIEITKKTKIIPLPGIDTITPKSHTAQKNYDIYMRPLLLNGGGKDGSASAYVLSKSSIDFTWFQRGNSKAQTNVTKEWNKPTLTVIRKLDDRRKSGKYSGHRPMSAGVAMLSLFTAQAFGYSHVIASNESSANEGNMVIGNFNLNHQYSKSIEFEQNLSILLKKFNVEVGYFSLLRPLNELQIGVFVSKLKPNQQSAITSCNHGTSTAVWCMQCAKCAFVTLIITAISPPTAEKMLGNYLAINTPALLPYIAELVNPLSAKPLECVGTIDECQVALSMVHQKLGNDLSDDLTALLKQWTPSNQASNKIMHDFASDLIPDEYHKAKDIIINTIHSYV